MHEMLQEIVDHTAERFGLNTYYLKRHHIYREKSNLNEISYQLSMEWFPTNVDDTDEDYNPTGTAVIEIDIHTKKLKRVVFVQDISYTDSILTTSDMEQIIEWIETETGLEFGRQFKLVHDENGELRFQAAIDNVPVYPAGSIQVQFNEKDQLVLFSIDGDFPNETQINWEPFSLTPDITEPIAKSQCKLLEIPVENEEKWMPVYGATTIFVTNSGNRLLSYDDVETDSSFVKKDIIMEWDMDTVDSKPFRPEDIDLSLEVSEQEALANKAHPDSKPLSTNDVDKSVDESRNFLQYVFPEDSGQWVLTGVHRKNGSILVTLKPMQPDNRVIGRKITLIITSESHRAINFIDNSVILDMLNNFQEAEKVTVTRDEAFNKLGKHIEVTPVYVYDKEQKRYVLCGKIDSSYGVNAISGEVISLDDL